MTPEIYNREAVFSGLAESCCRPASVSTIFESTYVRHIFFPGSPFYPLVIVVGYKFYVMALVWYQLEVRASHFLSKVKEKKKDFILPTPRLATLVFFGGAAFMVLQLLWNFLFTGPTPRYLFLCRL